MDPAGKFIGQNLVDAARTRHAGQPLKGPGHNDHVEMCLPARLRPRMASVACAVVNHVE